MFEFITLFFADRYMPLTNVQKRDRYLKLERTDRLLKKAFKWLIFISIMLCLHWDIYDIAHGSELYGIIDAFIECLIYPLVLWFLASKIRENRFGFIILMAAALVAMLCHTPSYSLMLVWCIALVTVRFMLSGLQSLSGYPHFHDDMRGKRSDIALTEQQKLAAFMNEVNRQSSLLWKDDVKEQNSEDLLSGKVDLDGYYGVTKCETPGIMDELVIPDDLDLEDLYDTKSTGKNG